MDEFALAQLRRDYQALGLDESMLPAEPIELWRRWLRDAQEAGLPEANAMVVATVDPDGTPSARLVLCKQADADGFVFFTNYASRKATALAADPRTSLLFPWHPIARQVRIDGVAERTSRHESSAYFSTRPRGAQLSAVASPQSSIVADRHELEVAAREAERRYAEEAVPCPAEWGGIRVRPVTVEFWQGRPNRLHDRLRYSRDGDDWVVRRLAP
jgi:pyridoxamine 5'-phosphate oxidase